MKSKKLTLTLLLIILTAAPIFTQESKNYKKTVQTEFGIDLKKSYSGEQVAEIIAICLEEKDMAIATAYEEGYKTGTLEYKPTLELYKRKCALLQQNNNSLKTQLEYKDQNSIQKYVTTFSAGFLAGGITGGIIGYKIPF